MAGLPYQNESYPNQHQYFYNNHYQQNSYQYNSYEYQQSNNTKYYNNNYNYHNQGANLKNSYFQRESIQPNQQNWNFQNQNFPYNSTNSYAHQKRYNNCLSTKVSPKVKKCSKNTKAIYNQHNERNSSNATLSTSNCGETFKISHNWVPTTIINADHRQNYHENSLKFDSHSKKPEKDVVNMPTSVLSLSDETIHSTISENADFRADMPTSEMHTIEPAKGKTELITELQPAMPVLLEKTEHDCTNESNLRKKPKFKITPRRNNKQSEMAYKGPYFPYIENIKPKVMDLAPDNDEMLSSVTINDRITPSKKNNICTLDKNSFSPESTTCAQQVNLASNNMANNDEAQITSSEIIDSDEVMAHVFEESQKGSPQKDMPLLGYEDETNLDGNNTAKQDSPSSEFTCHICSVTFDEFYRCFAHSATCGLNNVSEESSCPNNLEAETKKKTENIKMCSVFITRKDRKKADKAMRRSMKKIVYASSTRKRPFSLAHSGIKVHKISREKTEFKCKTCKKTFGNESTFQIHVRNCQDRFSFFSNRCQNCNEEFYSNLLYNEHLFYCKKSLKKPSLHMKICKKQFSKKV